MWGGRGGTVVTRLCRCDRVNSRGRAGSLGGWATLAAASSSLSTGIDNDDDDDDDETRSFFAVGLLTWRTMNRTTVSTDDSYRLTEPFQERFIFYSDLDSAFYRRCEQEFLFSTVIYTQWRVSHGKISNDSLEEDAADVQAKSIILTKSIIYTLQSRKQI